MSDYDDDSDESDDFDESTASEGFDEEYGKLEFEEAVHLAMNNKLPKVDYSKIMLDIERDSKRLGHDSSDDSNIKDESSNIENDDDDDRNDQSSEDDHQNYEYSEEEQSISDTDTYRDEDGESEEVFEKISAEEDQVVKKDKEEYFKKDSIPKWIEDLFPEDLINALNEDFTRPKNRGRTTSINADNVNDLAYYIEKRKKGFRDPLKGTKDVTPFHYSGKNYKFKCHTYISRNRLYKKAVYSPFKKNIQAPNWSKYLYIYQHIPYTVSTDILYDLAYECPSPIEYLEDLIESFEKAQCPLKLLSRTKKKI